MKKTMLSLLLLAVLVGCSGKSETVKKEDMEVSSTFSIPVTFGDGTEGEYVLVGEEGKIGFLVGSGVKGEAGVQSITAGEKNKYMWHLWGEPNELEGEFEVVGKNIDKDNEVTVFETKSLGGPNNGADAHTPSSMSLPSSGLWELNAYVGGELFGTIVVNAERVN